MKIYNKIKQVSDLRLFDGKISDGMEVLLSHLRKNYKTSLTSLNQNAIMTMAQEEYTESGAEVPIVLSFKDGSKFRMMIKNGRIGETGRQGKDGPDGDKGDKPTINDEYANSKGVIDWLTIANDCTTEDGNKVLSAFQGVRMNDAIEKLTETFLSEYQYALLFTDHVTIDAEFETFEDNQLVQLIAEDPDTHTRYTKYWTFESEGDQEYYVFNYFGQTYDSVYVDIWEDIYMGGRTGYFEATTTQLSDGTQLYIKNDKLNSYEPIEQFNDTIYVKGFDESGNDAYVPSTLTEGDGPWYIKKFLKVNGEYVETFLEVTQDYIDKNIEKTYGQRDFQYYLKTADCIVDVNYTRSDGYDFNLHATHLPENIWVFDHVGDDGNNVYTAVTFADVDVNAPIVYYQKTSDGFEAISDIKNYIKKKESRFYKFIGGSWTEVESIDNINLDEYEEYIVVNYVESSNTNTFTHYTHVKTYRDEYYDVHSGILNPYSIDYFVEYTDEEPRRYFTRRIISTTDKLGNVVFEYQYKEITIPFWLEAEFVTEEEDQLVRLLSNNPDIKEEGDIEIIDPIYISSIEFEDDEIEIAKNYNKDIKVTIYPENANVTDMILDYDDTLINIYEDGRIAALTDDSITRETVVKVYSEKDNSIGDEIKIKIVTPIESIGLNVESINLYPGTSLELIPTIVPEVVSNNKLSFTISDPDMLTIDKNNVVTPKKGSDGSYKMGSCELTITADDGFGASLTVPVLVAIPITNIKITSRSFGFVDKPFQLETEVQPSDATLVLLDYESSDENVLTISESGIIKPISEGEATITCSARDGSGVKTTQKMKITTGIDKVNIKNLQNSIEVGLTNKFEVEILPENATDKRISIFASDNSTVDISEPVLREGTTNIYDISITGVKGGSTQIVINTLDGSEVYAEQELTIPLPIEKILFEEPTVVIYEGDDVKVIRTIVTGPDSVANSSLEWYSDNIGVCTVDTNGRISPVKAGKANISAISKDENKVIGTCNVIVKKHSTGIKLNNGENDTIQILLNNFGFIPAEIEPYDASDQILRWSSSNELVVLVEDNGTIYGKALGTSIITATAMDRSDTAVSITVEVVKEITNKE